MRRRWQPALRFLESSFAGRCLRRFVELQAVDRALALSSRAFVALVPLGVLVTAVVPTGSTLGDRLVRRFGLDGASADAVRELFATSYEYRGPATVVSAVALLVACLSFARSLGRTYERIWSLPPLRRRRTLRGLLWSVTLAGFIALLAPLEWWLQDTGGLALAVLVAVALSTLLWAFTPALLLGGRVGWRTLLPGAVATAVSLDALTAVSVVYFARTIERSADAYGIIGVSFVFVGWLFSAALVLIGAGVVGAELSSGPTGANDRASLYSRLLARSKGDRDAAGG